MLNIFLIGLGSAFGGISRYLLASTIQRFTMFSYPWGTLVVNIIGSFLIGIMFVYLGHRFNQHVVRLDAFLVIGFLGGFTTFSAFSLQTIQLMQARPMWLSASYVVATVMLCLVACYGGMQIAKTAKIEVAEDVVALEDSSRNMI